MLALLGPAPEKTRVVHIDEGFHFLGHHIRHQRKRGTSKYYVYTMPSKKAIRSIKGKVSEQKTYRSNSTWSWTGCCAVSTRPYEAGRSSSGTGVSKAVFSAVDYHAWGRLMRWIRAKYAGKHRLG